MTTEKASHATAGALIRVSTAWLPLALVPVLVGLIADGRIDLGGGEKDLVWVLPWTLWSLLFGASAMILWRRGWSLPRALRRSAIVGISGVLLVAALMGLFGQLGVAGRF